MRTLRRRESAYHKLLELLLINQFSKFQSFVCCTSVSSVSPETEEKEEGQNEHSGGFREQRVKQQQLFSARTDSGEGLIWVWEWQDGDRPGFGHGQTGTDGAH